MSETLREALKAALPVLREYDFPGAHPHRKAVYDQAIAALAAPQADAGPVANDQIKHMVDRFLGWKLPDNFNPDDGISFERFGNIGTEHQYDRKPLGTNLFDAEQATAMVRYMVDGLATPPAPSADMRRAYSILCEPRESQASDNLEGALYDIERLSAEGKPTDDVCIRTIRRVLKQLVEAEKALSRADDGKKSEGGK